VITKAHVAKIQGSITLNFPPSNMSDPKTKRTNNGTHKHVVRAAICLHLYLPSTEDGAVGASRRSMTCPGSVIQEVVTWPRLHVRF